MVISLLNNSSNTEVNISPASSTTEPFHIDILSAMKNTLDPFAELKRRSSSFLDTTSEWQNRELQLTRLHEEIIARREVHLGYSMSYTRSQQARKQKGELVDIEKGRQRNEKYLQDLFNTEEAIQLEAMNPPSPRLTTLQSNYWSMVKSMKPLWERSLEHKSLSNPVSARSKSSARSNYSRKSVEKPERRSKKKK